MSHVHYFAQNLNAINNVRCRHISLYLFTNDCQFGICIMYGCVTVLPCLEHNENYSFLPTVTAVQELSIDILYTLDGASLLTN